MQIFIMRGLPGSGKTRWAEGIKRRSPSTTFIYSADDYFTDPKTREYRYIAKEIGDAHKECLRRFCSKLVLGTASGMTAATCIVVDNTNTSTKEMELYSQIALAYGHSVEVVQMKGSVERCYARQTHGVPLEVMWDMQIRIRNERLPMGVKLTLVPSFDEESNDE